MVVALQIILILGSIWMMSILFYGLDDIPLKKRVVMLCTIICSEIGGCMIVARFDPWLACLWVLAVSYIGIVWFEKAFVKGHEQMIKEMQEWYDKMEEQGELANDDYAGEIVEKPSDMRDFSLE